jgi:IMP dehydrogenase
MKNLTFDDILLVPSYNEIKSRRDVSIKSTSVCEKLSLELPVMSSNMDTITESNMATYMSSKGGVGVLHRFMNIGKNFQEYVRSPKETFVSLGCTEIEKKRAETLWDAGARHFCVDVAHGHSSYVGEFIQYLRNRFNQSSMLIMAGNVVTYEGCKFLYEAGASLIKVGIGPGSICSTRLKTGFGVPQLAALQACASNQWSIIADGGLKTPGDIVKALAFGADFVMLGGMLAGTEPTPGHAIQHKDNETVFYKSYRGMASKEAADDFLGGLSEWKTAEGVAVKVPYKGKEETDYIIQDIIGGLRSGLTYAGASTIKELREKKVWIEISEATRSENLTRKG